MKKKVMTAAEAVKLIKNGDTVATTGFLGMSYPEELAVAIEKSFLETGEPNNLLYLFHSAQGDQNYKAVNRFAHEGLVRRVIGGHYNLAPKMIKFVLEEKCEAYNLPQGVLVQLLRNIGSGRPGLLTHVGLKTFVDPRVEGGRLNKRTTEDIVEVVNFKGKEYLFYQALPINVGIIRGTTADENGNISIEREGYYNESLLVAQAAKNTGGIVIAQVERLTQKGRLDPKSVVVPGINVDVIVVADPENHMQTNNVYYDPSLCGETLIPRDELEPLPFNQRKIIARRAAMELEEGAIINLGIGIPEGIAKVAAEENVDKYITITVESGGIGGVPKGGTDFGAVVNPEALIGHHSQFDFYDGGGLDLAFLGLAQADPEGNINVSKFGTRIPGAGGFINITQNAKKVVFVGTLTAGGLEIDVKDGKLQIVKEGKNKKFVPKVEQITFSGEYARENNKNVLYITERAVFQLKEDGIYLIEIADGIDMQKDVLDNLDCHVLVSKDLKLMDERIFRPEPMNLEADIKSKA